MSVLTGKPVCMNCAARCSQAWNITICGTDKKTYNSYCNMLLSGCRSGVYLSTHHRGVCKKQDKTGQIRKCK